MSYIVVLGVPASLPRVQCALREVVDGDWRAVPLEAGSLRESFPVADEVVALVPRNAPVKAQAPPADAFVSHRHTVTRTLRRLVESAARQFGGVRLLVHQADEVAAPTRRQTTSLAGFLRSGRVVQDGVMLTITERG